MYQKVLKPEKQSKYMVKYPKDLKKNLTGPLTISSLVPPLDVLTKLRIIVGVIVLLSTFSMILVFFVDFFISVMLILVGYILLLALCIKLFVIHRL